MNNIAKSNLSDNEEYMKNIEKYVMIINVVQILKKYFV